MVSNQLLNQNETQDFKIVRYMNLAKFLALIAKSELFFCSLEELKNADPYEGELNQSDINLIIGHYLRKEFPEQYNNLELRNALISREEQIRNIVTKSIAISCWRILDCDCYAMWRLYSELDNGIAIVTTYSKLLSTINSLGKPRAIREVTYKNYEQEEIISNHFLFNDLELSYRQCEEYYDYFLNPQKYTNQNERNHIESLLVDFWNKALSFYTPLIFSKREEFKYENELRAATVMTLDVPLEATGLSFPINLNYLIDEICISPNAPFWLTGTIEKVLNSFGINNKPVYQSNLLCKQINV